MGLSFFIFIAFTFIGALRFNGLFQLREGSDESIKIKKYFSPIYDPRIIAEIEDMPYFPPIYDATFG